jgi:ketol-acid reductoisomerase
MGFGAQGRAHALNLRDSGVSVIGGLYPASKSRVRARRSGLEVLDTSRATQRGDVIFLALPDSAMPRIYGEQVATNLRSGQTLLFAHGFAIHYRTIVPRRDVDVTMVAPKGLGPMVRREFLRGRGAPGLNAIHQDPSRHAKQTALAWAKGIGCTRAGVIETTFREETETDLFGEQAVLCGEQARSFAPVSIRSLTPAILLSLLTSSASTNSSSSSISSTKREFQVCAN